MTPEQSKALMHERLDRRVEEFNNQIRTLRSKIDKGILGGEADRLWLDSKTVGFSKGVDVCCGDFLINNAVGVDGDTVKVGSTFFHISGAEMPSIATDSLEFVVTNYFDTFHNPLTVLHEWYRVLQPGGFVALVCKDAEQFLNANAGPLDNAHRASVFTRATIVHYLYRAKFVRIEAAQGAEKSIRVLAYKENR